MTDTANCTKGAAALAGMLMASPALAHGQWVFFVFMLPPVAAIMFLVAAGIARRVFQRTRGKVYAAIVVLCLALWVPGCVVLSVVLSDSHQFRASDEQIGIVLSFLPVGIALLLRFRHAQKRASRRAIHHN